ncbi:MAG: ABC-F family ATP-binding cassette domain-containing protein, partial [Burkholderiales bacterium]
LAKALFIPSDLLLLDEPTNHLDLETVIWLEDWLKRYQGLALIISHDREFLDNVTTHTLAISSKTLTLYSGNYSTFEKTRYQQMQQQQQMLAKNHARLAHLQSFVDRFRAKATKAKQAQSRLKMIEKLQVAQALPKDIEFSIQFLEPEYQVDKLLSLHEGKIGYPDKILLSNVRLDIFQNSRIGLLGKNGIGKSSFIKALIDGSTLLGGNLDIDHKIKIGYFAQHTVDQLDVTDSPLSFLSRQHKNKKEQEIRSYLGRYGFAGDKVYERIGNFSGGEKARLTIANIILQRPNILFLDEPTNHLDMQMREELASSIQDFNGSVIIVSHDKFLLQSVVDEFYLINKGALMPFTGTLDDYHEFLLTEAAPSTKPAKSSPQLKSPRVKIPKNSLKLNSEITQLEAQIAQLNQKATACENQITAMDLTQLAQTNQLEQLTIQYNHHKQQLIELENKWLELQLKLEGCK